MRSDGASIARSDSAGIEIVEVPGSYIEQLPVWRISEEPILSIGEMDGEDPYLFTSIIRGSVRAMEDGTIVIADGNNARGSSEIRVFDREGRYLRGFGGRGEGPGEFARLPSLQQSADGGLLAMDTNGRLTVFDTEGNYVDRWIPDRDACPLGQCRFRGALSNGSLVVLSTDILAFSPTGIEGESFPDFRTAYGLLTRDGYLEAATVQMPEHRAVARTSRGRGSGAPPLVNVLVQPARLTLDEGLAVATGRDHFVLTSYEPFEFRIFDAQAELVRIIRISRPRVPVTEEQKEAILDTGTPLLTFRGRWVADYWPEFGYVRFGDGDDLWIRDFQDSLLTPEDEPEWITIIGVDGTPVARLEVRPDPIWRDLERSAAYEVASGRDEYRVITRDQFGVPRLLLFEIVKG